MQTQADICNKMKNVANYFVNETNRALGPSARSARFWAFDCRGFGFLAFWSGGGGSESKGQDGQAERGRGRGGGTCEPAVATIVAVAAATAIAAAM